MRNAHFVSKRRPLEAVRVIRDRGVKDAARALTDAERRAEAARAEAEAAREAEASTRARARDALEAERRTVATARDLAQLAAFAVGQSLAVERAQQQADAADGLARESSAKVDEAREGLVVARVALGVVEKHQERARVRDDRARDARTDEVAEDAFAARFKTRTQGFKK